MGKLFSLRLFLLLISLNVFEGAEAMQKMPSAAEQEKLDAIRPNRNDILDWTVPWGINIDCVDKRVHEARVNSLDHVEPWTRVSIYQTHKSKDKKLSKEYAELSNSQYKEKKDLKEKIDRNKAGMNAMGKTLKERLDLTQEQLDALPDRDEWNEMKKEGTAELCKYSPSSKIKKAESAGSTRAQTPTLPPARKRSTDPSAPPEYVGQPPLKKQDSKTLNLPPQRPVPPAPVRTRSDRDPSAPPAPLKKQDSKTFGD